MLTAAARSAAPGTRDQTLFFDAVFTHLRTAGPHVNQVGHLQIAGGILRDAVHARS